MNHLDRRELLTLAGALGVGLGADGEQASAATAGGAAAVEIPRTRIDCQSHVFVPGLLALMEKRSATPFAYRRGDDVYVVVNQWHRKVLAGHLDIELKLAAMNAAGIDLALLSINDPGPELFGSDGPAVARMVHDHLADLARQHPGRFAALATLPLQDMKASLAELDRCLGLGFRGVLLYSNLDGHFPDEPQFRPLFAAAAARGVPILLHPAHPTTYAATSGYQMTAGLGLMFDTTIALCRLILSGVLEEFPHLKLVCPHVGGALPYLIGRVDHQVVTLKRGGERLRKPPREYLRQVYLDCVSPHPLAIKYAHDLVGADHLLYASDHPWVDPRLIADNIQSLGFSAGAQDQIFRGNAQRLFGL
jgi:predicted TIM-barrel fold metal-dependent hydrolase